MYPQDIPYKVLLHYLDWNNLLRLRGVCRRIKKMVDIYLVANSSRAPELEIVEGNKDKSVEAFLKMCIPTTKIFLNNPTTGFCLYVNEKHEQCQFLKDYGPMIKELRVTQITPPKNTGMSDENSAVSKPISMEPGFDERCQLRRGIEEQMEMPSAVSILKCYPNLEVIKLGNWQGSSQSLLVLWNGLGDKLKEVELENCINVTHYTSFGEDLEQPEFLKLKNLKKLSLKGMDKMNRVTDLFFTRILSQMKLKELVLTSDKPLEKVTKVGINSLLQGPFAETIQKFPFQGWSLANVTPKELEEMGKKFGPHKKL